MSLALLSECQGSYYGSDENLLSLVQLPGMKPLNMQRFIIGKTLLLSLAYNTLTSDYLTEQTEGINHGKEKLENLI